MKKMLNGLMAVLVLGALLAGMALAVLRPKTVNFFENRPAEALPAFSAKAALSGEFQDALDTALHDQIPAAQLLEENWQTARSAMTLGAVLRQTAARPNAYFAFNDLLLFGGDIVYKPIDAAHKMGELTAMAANLNGLFTAYPKLSYYVFYIEKDTDIDFETGASMGIGDAMLSLLWLPQERLACDPVTDYADFRARFFRTDHHWNRVGSYDGYLRLLELMGKTDPIQPEGTETLTPSFSGSKAIQSGAREQFTEPFEVYRYSFPEMSVTINGKPFGDYGNQTDPAALAQDAVSYSAYYGDDYGEVIFQTGNIGAGRILVLGESFDNAVVKLLASHFETLYAVDLRAYETDMGEPFRFGEYIEQHEIDTVLFIGNIDFFLLPVFHVEG